MLLLSFKTWLQIVSKFLVQVMWKDSYHFSPVQGSSFNTMSWFWKLLEKKKKHKSPGSIRAQEQFAQTGVSIKGFLQLCCPLKCILSCKRRTISLAVLMVQSKQTTKNGSGVRQLQLGKSSLHWRGAGASLGWGGPRAVAQPRLGSTEPWGLSPTKHAETFWPEILYVSLVEILSACPI